MNRNSLIMLVALCWLLQPISYGMGRDFILKTVQINLVDENNQVIRKFSLSPEKLRLLQQESTYFKNLPPELLKRQGVISLPIDDVDQETLALLSGTLHANQVRVQFVDENNEIVKGITLSSEQLKLLQKESLFFQKARAGFFKKEATISLPVENVDPEAFDLILKLLPQNKAAIEQRLDKVAPELIFNLILAINFLDMDKLKTIALSKQKIQDLAGYLMEQKDKLAQLTMPAHYTMCNIYPISITDSRILQNNNTDYANDVLWVSWSPDGRHIIVYHALDNDDIVDVWNVSSGKLIHKLTHGGVLALSFLSWSPNGKYFAILEEKDENDPDPEFKPIRIYNVYTGELVFALVSREEDIAWSPDSKYIAAVSSGKVDVLDTSTWKVVRSLSESHSVERTSSLSVAWSHDGKSIVALLGDDKARIWDARTGNLKITINEIGTGEVSWSSDDKHIIVMSSKSSSIWSSLTGNMELRLYNESSGSEAELSPDSKRIAMTRFHDNELRIFNTVTGQQEATMIIPGFYSTSAMAWSPDSKHIACDGDNGIAYIVNATTGQVECKLMGQEKGMYSIAWSPDGTHILTASNDYNARIWSIPPILPYTMNLDEFLISTALIGGAKIDNTILNMLSDNSIDFLLAEGDKSTSQIQPMMKDMLKRIRRKRPAGEITKEATSLQPPTKKKKTLDSEEASSSSTH